MTVTQPIDDVQPEAHHTLHVRVVTGQSVQVRGAPPQWLINLLQTGGDTVIVEGGDLPQHRLLAQLSDRELEVLTRIASGQGNYDIADAMFLSINTIKSYIRSTYRKIDVTTRTEAVIWAMEHGVVSTQA